jgi:hypothetical protein
MTYSCHSDGGFDWEEFFCATGAAALMMLSDKSKFAVNYKEFDNRITHRCEICILSA